MAKVKTKHNSEALVQLVVNALHEKKANDVVSLDLRNIKDTVANFFVVAHGDSNTHVNALHQTVVELTRQAGQPHYKVEGTQNGEWIIVDFIDVVCHIFHRDKRYFYQLEELWQDAPSTKHTTEELKTGRGKVVPFNKKSKNVQQEIDTKEYKDKVTSEKLYQKALREKIKESKKAGTKAPAKKAASKKSAAKPAPKKTAKTAEKSASKVAPKKAAAKVPTKAAAKKAAPKKSVKKG